MEFEVAVGSLKVDFAPETDVAEILQNVKSILSTPKYSAPLNREFGLSLTMLDGPLPIAQARMKAEIIETLKQWEPRVEVVRVTYDVIPQEGILRPKVQVRIRE